MSATVLSSRAGTARRLEAGGWAVDLGDLVPTWAEDRESAWALLTAHDPSVSSTGPSASPVVCSPSGSARSGPNLLDP